MPVKSPRPSERTSPIPPADSQPGGLVAPPGRRSPRPHNDPDRFIRQVKGGKYQARPFLEYRRYNLGSDFETKAEARKAILEFWWGKRREVLPWTKRFKTPAGGVRYMAVVPLGGKATRVGGWYATRELAHAVAVLWIRVLYRERAGEVLSRYEPGRLHYPPVNENGPQ